MDDTTKELIAIGASVAVQVGFMVEDGAGKAIREYALGPESELVNMEGSTS